MADAVSETLYSCENFGVLRGLSNAGDPLCMLGVLLSDLRASSTRRWIIDNRAVETRLHPDDLEQFLDQILTSSADLRDIAVAWVGSSSWGHAASIIPDTLPFRFEIFEEIGKARDWLKSLY